MVPYDPGRSLVSLHIPKTAGTSFRAVLQTWFGDGLHLHYPAHGRPQRVADRPGVCVHGHFNRDIGMGVNDYYPDARQFITILREPFDRFVSLWLFLDRHRSREGWNMLDGYPTFEPWFADHKRRALDDPATTFLRHLPEPATDEGLEALFRRRFVAVGVTERLQDSVDLIARRLGKQSVLVPHENRAPEVTQTFERYRAEHEATFVLEHRAYALAARMLDEARAA